MPPKTERFEMRLDQEMINRLDDWRKEQLDFISRAEAIRRLIEIGLGTEGVRISDGEKLILSALMEIHRPIVGEGGDIDSKFVLSALTEGHDWALKWKYPSLLGSNVTREETTREVLDILEMWDFLERGYGKLSSDDKKRISSVSTRFAKNCRFPGFNNSKEFEHLSISEFLVEEMERFPDLKGRDLRCLIPMLNNYRQMLLAFAPIREDLAGRELGVSEIINILNTGKWQ